MAKFQVVIIALLVPHGDESYSDLLSDFRDDHPDMLAAWTTLTQGERLQSVRDAEAAWLDTTLESIDLKRYERPHDAE